MTEKRGRDVSDVMGSVLQRTAPCVKLLQSVPVLVAQSQRRKLSDVRHPKLNYETGL